jgi:hypothetical protein
MTPWLRAWIGASLLFAEAADSTPPLRPSVSDDGAYTSSTTRLHASWRSADPESGVVEFHYQIRQRTADGPIVVNWTSTGAVPSVTVTGLTLVHGTKYFFAVRARNGSGLWSPAGRSNGIVVDRTRPSAPGRPTEGPGPDEDWDRDGAYTVRWTAATDEESGIAAYQVQERRGPPGAAWKTLTSTATARDLPVSGRSQGERRVYRVRARNHAGLWGAWSKVSDGIVVDKKAPQISGVAVTDITIDSVVIRWTTDEPATSQVEYGPTPGYGASTPTGATRTTEHVVAVSGLAVLSHYHFRLRSRDAAGNEAVSGDGGFTTALVRLPSLVTVDGRRLLVERRNPDGSLAPRTPYVIRGVNWSPAGSDTDTDGRPSTRRPEFGKWYLTDIPLIAAMNANTVRTFMDLGLPGDRDRNGNPLVDGLRILDEFHRHGIMVIMTVDDSTNDTVRLERAVARYKDHPAILLWSLGSEWSINRYFDRFSTENAAAVATEHAAQDVKQIDSVHPVASSYGTIVKKPDDVERYVNEVCPTVDVWSLNEYRGPGFSRLFQEWGSISGKPMFLGEFGIDAYDSVHGREDQTTHALWVQGLWDEIARNLSADDPARIALGGVVFEWNDEWWKSSPRDVQDVGGWNPPGFPDATASEDWWGIATVGREPRQLHGALGTAFSPGYVPPPAGPTITYQAISRHIVKPDHTLVDHAEFWENGAQMYLGLGASMDGGRGFNVAAVDPATGRLRDSIKRFDTWHSRQSGAAMTDMIAYLDDLPDGTLVLIAIGDEAGLNNFSACSFLSFDWVQEGLQRLEALGSMQIRQYCYGDMWSMIAIKGQGVALGESLVHEVPLTTAAAVSSATIEIP